MMAIKQWLAGKLFKLFMVIGTRFFRIIVVYAGTDKETVRGVHFFMSERDMNTSCREWVEYLDQPKIRS